MKIIGFIPARGGSKGLPGKNKKEMCGKPLIAYAIEAALDSDLSDVVVSSDDDEILDIARRYNNVHVIKRPDELSGDLVPTQPVLLHALNEVNGTFDAVMTLQATSPLRTTKHINDCIALFSSDPEADSLVSVVKVPHKYTSSSIMVMEGKYVKPMNEELVLRRQDKPNYWARNGAAVYITRIDKIKDFIFGGKIIPYEMSILESIDIDDFQDWQMAEALMLYNQNKL